MCPRACLHRDRVPAMTAAASGSGLFRPEAVRAASARPFGQPVALMPRSWWALTGFFLAFAVRGGGVPLHRDLPAQGDRRRRPAQLLGGIAGDAAARRGRAVRRRARGAGRGGGRRARLRHDGTAPGRGRCLRRPRAGRRRPRARDAGSPAAGAGPLGAVAGAGVARARRGPHAATRGVAGGPQGPGRPLAAGGREPRRGGRARRAGRL